MEDAATLAYFEEFSWMFCKLKWCCFCCLFLIQGNLQAGGDDAVPGSLYVVLVLYVSRQIEGASCHEVSVPNTVLLPPHPHPPPPSPSPLPADTLQNHLVPFS